MQKIFLVPKLIGVCVLLLITLAASPGTILADESITVACYTGNQNVGNVVVFNLAGAARACDNMYYDCKGRCIGCVYDYDYVHDVCVDASGSTFLRP